MPETIGVHVNIEPASEALIAIAAVGNCMSLFAHFMEHATLDDFSLLGAILEEHRHAQDAGHAPGLRLAVKRVL